MKKVKSLIAIVFLVTAIFLLSACACSHEWLPATCDSPEYCVKCGETQGTALGHNWKAETAITPKMCLVCGKMMPMTEPDSGEVIIGTKPDYYSSSTLTIRNTAQTACYIKMKDSSGNDVYSFYVRAGDNVEADVPSGNYYVYFASGVTWYGPEYCFGTETSYSKDSELRDFNSYEYEYTLYPVVDGNFEKTPINPDEF